MYKVETEKLDKLVQIFESYGSDKLNIVIKMIALVRSVSKEDARQIPVVENVKSIIEENIDQDISVANIAELIGISIHYMMHTFKKATGITILEYIREKKLTKAKRMLIDSNASISLIAQECGFSSSAYFSEVFLKNEYVTPSEYRKTLKGEVKCTEHNKNK
jgi:AraC-like DNA-binding protein